MSNGCIRVVVFILSLFLAVNVFSMGDKPLNVTGLLFNVSLNGMTLTFSPKANHSYPNLGMLITNPNYNFSTPNTQCASWPNTEGYCKFSASQTSPASISIDGPIGVLTFKLCLNFWGKLTCQYYTIDINESSRCTGAGGKIVLNSNSCWIKQIIPVSTIVLRCSDVCANVGLVLQDPGPINNATLAGNVCAAYGYTNTPTQASPTPMTFIGQVDQASPTSCYWDNVTNTNWNNPNNGDYNNGTGSYFCPCI